MKNEDKNKNKEAESDDEDEDLEPSSSIMAGVRGEISEQLVKKPKKGILKQSSSFESSEPTKKERPKKKLSAKWDEMNIIATLHPADKDYGHMKIDEPPTPYEYAEDDEDEVDGAKRTLNAAELADKIRLEANLAPKALRRGSTESGSSEEDEETPEQKAQRREFEIKRKAHYNEFMAAKLAKKMIEEEDDDEDDDDDYEIDENGKKRKKNANAASGSPSESDQPTTSKRH